MTDFLKGIGHHLTDVNRTEVLTLAPLFGLALLFGLFPAVLLDLIQAPVTDLLAHVGSATTVTGSVVSNPGTGGNWLVRSP